MRDRTQQQLFGRLPVRSVGFHVEAQRLADNGFDEVRRERLRDEKGWFRTLARQ